MCLWKKKRSKILASLASFRCTHKSIYICIVYVIWSINVPIFPTVSLQLIKTSNPLRRHFPKTPSRLSAGGSASVSITKDLPWWWWWWCWSWRILDSNKTMGSHNHNNNNNSNSNNNNNSNNNRKSSIAKCVAMPMQILWLPLCGCCNAQNVRTEPVAVPDT